MGELENKKILLIALSEYSQGLIEEIKKMGADVEYICDKPNNGVICKTLGRIKFRPYIRMIQKYYSDHFKRLKNRKFDYILCIRGEYTPVESLVELKKVFPDAKLILYMWDSIKNNKGIEKKWDYYDKVYTFDRIDYINNINKIDFLPLFYYNSYLPEKNEKYEYDIAFIGTGHGDRAEIIKGIHEQCKQYGLKMFEYIFLPHPFIFFRNKIFNSHYGNIKKSDIHFDLMPTQEAYRIYSGSKCIVDIESKTQHGLTMRTIEMIGLRKKLITTNKDIINYDFYNENNILIVDRLDFKIDPDFVHKPYVDLEEKIYSKYSLSNWLLSVLDISKFNTEEP